MYHGVSVERLNSLGRLGGSLYASLSEPDT